MKLVAAVSLVLAAAWGGSQARAASQVSDRLEIVSPKVSLVVSLSDLRAKLKVQSIEVHDPLLSRKVRFDAFELNEVIALAGSAKGAAGDEPDELVFTALDGYAPSIALSQLKGERAYVAFRETGNPKKWTPVRQGKALLSPAPYRVLWVSARHELPAPYQLVKIEMVSYAKKYSRLFPAEAPMGSSVRRGFMTFKAECVRCHSVNLQGGDLAPELNVPKNVLEYWSRDTLRAFIPDASAFRAKSKMPPFPKLALQQVDEILDYLDFMRERKRWD